MRQRVAVHQPVDFHRAWPDARAISPGKTAQKRLQQSGFVVGNINAAHASRLRFARLH